MKILKYAVISVFALVGLCVLALLAIGGLRGTALLQSDVVIAKPPSQVYPWIAEGDRLKQWVSWLVEVRPLTPGITGAGSKEVWVMDDPNMGERIEITGEVVAADAPRLRQAKMRMPDAFSGVITYQLTDIGGSTRLQFTSSYEFESWFARLLAPIVTRQAQQKMISDVATLKRLAEAN
jgi:uncharacterized protein YndB with AHSA1/START domain